MTPGRLRTLCELEWTAFGVGWPSGGTLDLATVRAVYQIITGTPGHPDQFPYIDSWLNIAQTLPPWIRFCSNGPGQCKILAAQPVQAKKTDRKKPIFQGDAEDEICLPPPYAPKAQTPPVPLETPPPSVSPPPQPEDPEAELSPQPEPVGRRLRSTQAVKPAPSALQMPLRETQGPQQVGEDGTVQPGHPVLYYQPFSTTDLLNWRHHTPSYSEKPQAMIDLIESIFHSHRPTWEDVCQLLLTLFNTEERRRILTEARKWLQGRAPGDTMDVEAWAMTRAPDTRPDWDFNTQEGREALREYREAILQGLKAGAKKPTNMSKTTTVTQRPDETPTDFYERLCETFRVYTPFDPEAQENQRMVNAAFVAQSYPDIRRKLQKLDGFAGMNATQLLEVANKVFVNRKREAQREADQRMKQKAALLAAALGKAGFSQNPAPPRKRGPQPWMPLGRDQCAYCRETGHWKNECPNRKDGKRALPKRPTYQLEPPASNHIGLAGVNSE
ncbi:uncharacterized protein [Vicugna pacos]|uniref:CCHC-type domain-containing protein n=1 Tax=Vicugna pacos TaxID=30538 RepID=A0ABM5BE58_VICPA